MKLRAYTLWPDMDKIKTQKHDQYDYIALCFDVAFEHATKPKNEDSAYALAYLFVDYHDGKANLNFDYLPVESTDDYYYAKVLPNQKCSKSKTIIIQGQDTLKFKQPFITSVEEYKNVEEALFSFFKETFRPYLLSIEPYLKKNDIGYDEKRFQEFINGFDDFVQNFFSSKSLSEIYSEALKKKHTSLFQQELDNTLPENPVQIKKRKI